MPTVRVELATAKIEGAELLGRRSRFRVAGDVARFVGPLLEYDLIPLIGKLVDLRSVGGKDSLGVVCRESGKGETSDELSRKRSWLEGDGVRSRVSSVGLKSKSSSIGAISSTSSCSSSESEST